MNKKQILIVEDDPTMRKALVMMLQSEIRRISDAATKSEADQLLTQSQFDLVISDLFLGDDTGYELYLDHHQNNPFLIITGNGDSELAAQVRQIEGIAYMEKPFTRSEFKELVDALLENAALEQDI